jgi:ABC-type multidrug transport system fused ATPase/permease subunit
MGKGSSPAQLLDLFSKTDKRRGLLVLGLMLMLALLDMVGVASLVPFLSVLGNPSQIQSTRLLRWGYEVGGFASTESYLFALGIGAFTLIVLSSLFSLVTTYAMTRYVQMRRYSLSTRLLQAYLRQPYEFFLNRNSSDLGKTILSEVDTVIMQVLKPAMDMLAYSLVALVLVGLLIAVNPQLALIISGVLGGAYLLMYVSIRRLLHRAGTERLRANAERFQAATEVFGGIKDLKVLGREQAYMPRFRRSVAEFSRKQYLQATLSAAPKYLVEAIGFGGILLMTLGLMATRHDLGQVLPLIGLYAFASYRLLPAAQQIYSSVSALRFGWPAVEAIERDLLMSPAENSGSSHPAIKDVRQGIKFSSVSFRYPNADGFALSGVNIVIPARQSVGFVGRSGAGKTTAVDLLLGLLQPTQGSILVDGVSLSDLGSRAWQGGIGYVPQHIYLADASVAENIAFGINPAEVDMDAVVRAAKVANIHDFVTSELPLSYQTPVGERGVRLSGGQRQRIGIARALYHDPPVLVLDEATSALDTATERAVMEAVEQLSGKKTVVIIAHRMSTVERCDSVVMLEKGRVVATGPFHELAIDSPAFRSLVHASEHETSSEAGRT